MEPPDSGLSYRFPVSLSHWARDEAWLRAEANRLAGNTGCFVDSQGWRGTVIWFDSVEKAQAFGTLLSARYKTEAKARPRRRICPIEATYSKAALAQHAVVWGLSSGIMVEVVRAYRRSRYECSSHGVANHAAAEVIVARCPQLDHGGWDGIEHARDLAEYMLVYYERRHRSWFWKGLEGKHQLFPFSYHI